MRPASIWLRPTADTDSFNTAEKSGCAAVGAIFATACGARTCAVIWRICESRLLTSIVLIAVRPHDVFPTRGGFLGVWLQEACQLLMSGNRE